MTGAPSSTWFAAPPHWEWLIILYFFVGGIAGGCYFLAITIDLFGRPEDRPLARLGYYIAFPAVVVSALLLSIDLGKPLRMWHMLIERNTLAPMFKSWSPMSIGSWALLIFGAFTFVSFIAALADDDGVSWPGLRQVQPRVRRWRPAAGRLRPPSIAGAVIAVVGGVFGFFIAGYTGVLLAVTNQPIWSDTPLLGMLFIVSAASSAAALMILLAHRAGWTLPGIVDLHRMEFIVLIAVMVSLGSVLQAWLNAWGLLLLLGVILVGMVLPLMLAWRPRSIRGGNVATASLLVLIGGFLLRVIIVLSAQSV
jgi:formate-dependent nitrite reductase membrane component NrfD